MTDNVGDTEPKKRSDWFKSLVVKGDFSPATMDSYFAQAQDWLKSDMDFVGSQIGFWRGKSHWIRGFAFLAVAAGVLLPIPLFDAWPGWPTGMEWGYFSIVLGGLVLLLDRTFNMSGAWVRLTLAEMKVKQVRYRLDLDWAKRRPLLTDSNGATEGPALIELLRVATEAAHEIAEGQKVAWTTEMTQALDGLRARLDADRGALERLQVQRQLEQERPTTGAFNITIDKPQDLAPPLVVKVGSDVRGTYPSVPSKLSIADVPAGLQILQLTAKRKTGGAQFDFGTTETVVAGEVKAVAVAVPPA
jgi:hypothetical protein